MVTGIRSFRTAKVNKNRNDKKRRTKSKSRNGWH